MERASGRWAPTAGGRAASSGRSSLVVACLVLLLGFGWAFAAPAGATEAGVSLFDDDDGRALFVAADRLAPGATRQACISVGARSAVAGDSVTFAATGVTGRLAEHLSVTLEIGAGGRFGDCTGFTGTTLWTGTLAGLATASAGDGLATGWRPDTDPVRSFRVTVVLDPDLTEQGLSATGDLSWRLFRDVVPPTPTPTPTPTDGSTATPAPTDDRPSPGPTESPTPSPTTSPTTSPPGPSGPTATPAPDPTGTSGPPDAGPDVRPDVEIGGGFAVLRETARRAATTAYAVIADPQYPLLAILVAVAFLAVQDLIDRRDPKLVAASMSRRDSEEVFPDLLAPGGGGPV